MKPFNRPEILQAIRAYLGMEGDFTTPVVEAQQLVTIQGDATRSPYGRYPRQAARGTTQAAVAAQNGIIVVRPQAGFIYTPKQITINNEQATAFIGLIAYFSATNISALGIATAGNLFDTGDANDVLAKVPVDMMRGTFAFTNQFAWGARISIAPGTTYRHEFKQPYPALWADAANGPGGVGVVNLTANEFVAASFEGDVWPIRR